MNSKEQNSLISFFEDEQIETFDDNFQNKFLKVFIEDDAGFVEQIMDVLHLEFFDSYQKLCNYIMELDENNRIALAKARMGHDIYGHDYFDLLATEDVIYLLKEKMKEIEKND